MVRPPPVPAARRARATSASVGEVADDGDEEDCGEDERKDRADADWSVLYIVGTTDMKYWNLWKWAVAMLTVRSSGFTREG